MPQHSNKSPAGAAGQASNGTGSNPAGPASTADAGSELMEGADSETGCVSEVVQALQGGQAVTMNTLSGSEEMEDNNNLII